jgi:hypothetical protein
MEEMRNAYGIVVGKPEWKSPLGKPNRRWEYNIRMDLRENVWRTGCIWLKIGTSGGLF